MLAEKATQQEKYPQSVMRKSGGECKRSSATKKGFMAHWRTLIASVFVGALLISSLGLGGCIFNPSAEGKLALKSPTIAPPNIVKEGKLRVGVDSSRPPYAGKTKDTNEIIGIDVDVAAVLAEEMGLQLEIVDTSGLDVNKLLKNGEIDVIMGLQSDLDTRYSEVKVGPYLIDGPAIFTVGFPNGNTEFNPQALQGQPIAAQEGSFSAWRAGKIYGDDYISTFSDLHIVFDQLGEAYSYVAADAIVGSAIAVKKRNIYCMGLLDDPQGIYMGVAADKSELVTELTKVLRTLRANGTLQIVVSKWLGPTAAQILSVDTAITSEGSSSAGTNDNAKMPTSGDDNDDNDDADDDTDENDDDDQ